MPSNRRRTRRETWRQRVASWLACSALVIVWGAVDTLVAATAVPISITSEEESSPREPASRNSGEGESLLPSTRRRTVNLAWCAPTRMPVTNDGSHAHCAAYSRHVVATEHELREGLGAPLRL